MLVVQAFYNGSDTNPEQYVTAQVTMAADDWMRSHAITRAQIVSTHVNAGSVHQGPENALYYEYTLTLIVDLPEEAR